MSSTYCAQADLELFFGTNGIDQWADLDADAAKKATRITRAIATAGDQIDAVLRTTKYANRIPVVDPSSNTTPTLIRDLAAVLAAVWLYDGRGAQEKDKTGQPYHAQQFRRDWAMTTLEQIRTGQIEIGALC